jgi:anhydro-N-acetylmuramic acid kinase
MKKKGDLVLGIMSGTSFDGVDYALCEISKNNIELKKMWSHGYPASLKKRLLKAAHDELSSYEVAQLHHDLGRFYALKAPTIKCDYVGLHGQTIFHRPHKTLPATYQIGEPAYLGAKLKVPVINQFRNMDLAMGGQGAPLATLFHRAVFSHPKMTVAVNNLGGISNVTYLPAGLASQKILSFDTGPANMLIDRAMEHFTKGKTSYDEEGFFASQGLADQGVIDKWLKHPFFKIKPPKSTGREEFGAVFFKRAIKDCQKARLNPYDTVATFTDFTAMSIAITYAQFLPKFPDLVVLSGGGAMNPTLVSRIRWALRNIQWEKFKNKMTKPVDITTTDALGWPAQSIEAAAFALLAYRTVHGLSGNIPTTTGATRAAILGQITPAP